MFDFSGWATKNNLRCSDGRTIKSGALKHKKVVPLFWNHQHNSPEDILGKAYLTDKEEGTWADCEFNDNPRSKAAKEAVIHGDIEALSIWANNVEQLGNDVIHGVIKEVSLVMAGANPGAYIESVFQHGEPMADDDDEGIFYMDDSNLIIHAEDDPKDKELEEKTTKSKVKDSPKDEEVEEKTVENVIKTLNDDQKKAVALIIAAATSGSSDIEVKEDIEMKHNLFSDGTNNPGTILSHSDMETIIADGKRLGTLKEAIKLHMEEGGILAHAIDTEGLITGTGNQSYGVANPELLYPDYKPLTPVPEWISRDMGWVQKVLMDVHRSPFARIKSIYANITEDDARAKGYIKGKQKKEEVFTILKRTTDPQMVYKFQKIDRDDIIDITDFNMIAWIKSEMQLMLNEELARAILIGDGRPSDSEEKIKEDRIRPISKDVSLFNITKTVDVSASSNESEIANATINTIIRSRKEYKGSGNPKFWTTEDVLTGMLLLEDKVGRKIYKTEQELATALRVNEIVTVEPMSGVKIKVDSKELPLIGIITNLADYNLGNDKGGEVNMFDDFDIKFNQQLYLIETKASGALIKPFSAITIALNKSESSTTPSSPGMGE